MNIEQTLKTWPEEIWLVCGDELEDYKECQEVSWCPDPAMDGNVRYVRADVAPPDRASIEIAAYERAAQIADSVNNFDNPTTAKDVADAIRALEPAQAERPAPVKNGCVCACSCGSEQPAPAALKHHDGWESRTDLVCEMLPERVIDVLVPKRLAFRHPQAEEILHEFAHAVQDEVLARVRILQPTPADAKDSERINSLLSHIPLATFCNLYGVEGKETSPRNCSAWAISVIDAAIAAKGEKS